jgi:hypothetical protein
MSNELINLRLQNNTSSTIPSSLLSITSTTTNTANATTRYTYDLGGVSLTGGTATITINNSPISISFVGTIQGLVNALNSLNYGYFLVSGNTIYTQDNTNVYGTLVSPPNSPYPYLSGNPQLVFDFSSTTSYSNSGTSIADLSGSGNNGIFSTGTGNGTPATVTGYSTNGYLNFPGTAAQLSVRLPDSLKPTGVVPFTYIVYMQPNGYSYNGNFPGIISNQQNNAGLGFGWVISPSYTAPGQQSARAPSPNDNNVELAYSGGAGLGVWSVYAIKFDGTSTTLFQYYNGVLYSANTVGASSVTSSSSWGLFLGLRYNMWINARFNYVAMYNTALSDSQITTIASTLSQRVIV